MVKQLLFDHSFFFILQIHLNSLIYWEYARFFSFPFQVSNSFLFHCVFLVCQASWMVPLYHTKLNTELSSNEGYSSCKAFECIYRNRALIYGQSFSFTWIFLLFSSTVKFSGEYNQDSVFIEITLIEAWS